MRSLFFRRVLRKLFPWLLFLLLAAAGVLLLQSATLGRPWARSDSVEYIVSARSLLQGQGLGIPAPDGRFMPLSLQHPPFYPLFLLPVVALFPDPFPVIGVLNMLLLAGSLFLVGVGLWRASGSWLWGLLAVTLVLCSPVILSAFTGAMSEPLFLFLSLLALFLLLPALQHPQKTWWAWAAICAGLALLTRYLGAASLLAGAVAFLFLGSGVFLRRLWQAVRYGLVGSVPMLGWLVYTFLQIRSPAEAGASSQPVLFSNLLEIRRLVMEVLVTWLPNSLTWFPTWRARSLAVYLIASLSLALLCLLWFLARRRTPRLFSSLHPAILSALYILAYLLVLILARLFSPVPPDINVRMLSPLQPFLFILLIGVLVLPVPLLRWPRTWLVLPLALTLITCYTYTIQTRQVIEQRQVEGWVYADPAWQESELMAAIRALPTDTPLISNEAALVLLYTGRFPYTIAELEDEVPATQFNPFGTGSTLAEQVFRHGGVLALIQPYFNDQLRSIYSADAATRAESFLQDLDLILQTSAGSLYTFAAP